MSAGRILIADDDESMRRILSQVLQEEGYSCVVTATGKDALEMTRQQDFDLVLLDLKMPGITGLEVLSTLNQAHSNICLIVVTGVIDEGIITECMKLGASGCIIKPFRLEEVVAMVAGALESKREYQ